ncbi:hypothetical protein [Miltoncostaea marina]|uniref:hypothetical protein n=1 Tax=Miltoncostaea marina TaxID=2843215 RepID=UPI001C3D3AF6|nr:hypothetical protein [Miltoncostaea marina]
MSAPFGEGAVLWSEAFPYADGLLRTVGAAKWANAAFWTGQASPRVVAQQAAGPASQAWVDAYTLAIFALTDQAQAGDITPGDAAEGFDVVARGLVKATGNTNPAFTHFFGTPGGSPTMYTATQTNRTATDGLAISKGSSFTSLLAEQAHEWTNGHHLGLRVVPIPGGVALSLWRSADGSSWTQVGFTVNDTSSPLRRGRLAIECFSTANRWDAIEVRTTLAGDTTAPSADVTAGPTPAKISAVPGYDASAFTFVVDEPCQAWELRAVGDPSDPRDAGDPLVLSGGAVSAATPAERTVTYAHLEAAGIAGADGTKGLKLYARDLADNWSS